MGDFYDFKLYIIINDKAEILSYTQAKLNDREPLKN